MRQLVVGPRRESKVKIICQLGNINFPVQASLKGFKLPGQHVVALSRVGLAGARLPHKDTTKDGTRYKINKCTIATYRSQDMLCI